MTCKLCGSHAINHNAHGRDGTKPDLCDVCFWRSRYDYVTDKLRNRIADLEVESKSVDRMAKLTPKTKPWSYDDLFKNIK